MTKYKPNELPATVTTPISIGYHINGYRAGELDVHSWDCGGDKDQIVILKTEATFDISQVKDLEQLAVASLTEAIKTAQAEAYRKISELEAVREKFLQLSYQPVEVLPPEGKEYPTATLDDDEIPF